MQLSGEDHQCVNLSFSAHMTIFQMFGPWTSLGEKGFSAAGSKPASESFGPWGSVPPAYGDVSQGEQGCQASGSKRACESFGPWASAPVLGDAKRAKLGPIFGPWSRPSSSKTAQKRAAVDFELACVLDTPAALRGQAKSTVRTQRAQDARHVRIPEWNKCTCRQPH
jgi:hypothetical protein